MGRYFKEEIPDRSRNSAVPVFTPSDGLFVVIDGDNEIYLVMFHPRNVFLAWEGKTLRRPELRMGMEVPDYLELVELVDNGLDSLMVLFVDDHAFMPPVRRLETECMFDDKPVFQPVPQEIPEAFLLVYFGGT